MNTWSQVFGPHLLVSPEPFYLSKLHILQPLAVFILFFPKYLRSQAFHLGPICWPVDLCKCLLGPQPHLKTELLKEPSLGGGHFQVQRLMGLVSRVLLAGRAGEGADEGPGLPARKCSCLEGLPL